MKERIKQIRKSCGITQQEFADRLGISRSNIATYETGKSNLGDAVTSLICKEFNVNEKWLRTGEGDMFDHEPKTVIDELTATMGLSDFEVQFLEAYFKLDKPTREAFSKGLTEISKSMTNQEHKKSATGDTMAKKLMFSSDAAAKGAG